MKTVMIPLADGFEEVEAVTIIDVLRRADMQVTVAGIGGPILQGAHSLRVEADCILEECRGDAFDLVVLPGGMPGAANLAESEMLLETVKRQYAEGRLLGAICAAPAVVLADKGIVDSEKMAAYPGFRERIPDGRGVTDMVCHDGMVITGAGPGAAMEFSLELVKALCGEEKAASVAEGMLV